jgi:hypothetical protein
MAVEREQSVGSKIPSSYRGAANECNADVEAGRIAARVVFEL